MDERPMPPKPLCEVLLRVNSLDERWIRGATAKFDDPTRPPIQTDNARRALVSVSKGDSLQGFVNAAGFATMKFSVGCSEPQNQEKILTLTG
jgi:hypothetical protein